MEKVIAVTTFNFSEMAPLIVQAAAEHGFHIDLRIEDYDLFQQNTHHFESGNYVLALDLRDVFPEYFTRLYPMHCSEIEYRCHDIIERIADFAKNVHRAGGRVVVHNFHYPPHLVSGIFDFQNPSGQLSWIDYLNNKLSHLPETVLNTFVFNLQYYLYQYGADRAFDEERYYALKIPFTKGFQEHLAGKYATFMRTLFRTRKKCLVVDLDNTLWGGILGEDGPEGILLGEQYPGNIYKAIQHTINQYADQGVLLALCSKNNEHEVDEIFRTHPGMVLRYEDFVVKRINWKDKVTNLQSIAQELGIGLDGMIFIDDSQFDVEMVKQALPEVETIQLVADNPLFNLKRIQKIESLQYVVYVEEDMKRQAHYRQRRMADGHRREFSSLEGFHKSLQISVDISLDDQQSARRIAQLTQKTNQFNLTAKPYSESGIAGMMTSQNARVYSLRVSDRFGDNGITGVAIVKTNRNVWEIDSFLLSCRVIGRDIERALLSRIQEDAIRDGIRELVGYYVPTPRNGLVEHFYMDNGFKKTEGRWILDNHSCLMKAPEWILIK